MAWADIATRTATVETLAANVQAVIPTDGSRLTAPQFAAIRKRGEILRDLGADLVMLADQFHPLSQWELDDGEIESICEAKDLTREITRDARGREQTVILTSATLKRRVTIVRSYNGDYLAGRTVTAETI